MKRATLRAILVLIAVIGSLLLGATQTAQAGADRIQIDKGAKAHPSNAALVYGWSWNEVVDVYDATGGNSSMKVAQAAAEWAVRSGVDIQMTNDITKANIVVNSSDTSCGVGCAYFPPVADGVASGTCNAVVYTPYKDDPVAEHIVIHEVGHCLGLAHAETTRAVMYWSVSQYDFFTKPQSPDYRDMKYLYGR